MKYLQIVILIFIVSCSAATKRMRGQSAQLLSGDEIKNLKVTDNIDKAMSLENYVLLNIYFRNLNNFWLRVKSIRVTSVHNDDDFNVILGNDLETWMKSVKLDSDLKREDAKKNEQIPKLKKYLISDHIYNNFSIPSKLQTQKWLLLQVSNKKAKWVNLEIEFIDSSRQTYKVEMK